jgi:hypothetical protein
MGVSLTRTRKNRKLENEQAIVLPESKPKKRQPRWGRIRNENLGGRGDEFGRKMRGNESVWKVAALIAPSSTDSKKP